MSNNSQTSETSLHYDNWTLHFRGDDLNGWYLIAWTPYYQVVVKKSKTHDPEAVAEAVAEADRKRVPLPDYISSSRWNIPQDANDLFFNDWHNAKQRTRWQAIIPEVSTGPIEGAPPHVHRTE